MTDLKTGDSIPISLADLVRAKIGDELYIQIKDKKIPVRCKISSVDSDTMATLTVLPKGTITPPTMPID